MSSWAAKLQRLPAGVAERIGERIPAGAQPSASPSSDASAHARDEASEYVPAASTKIDVLAALREKMERLKASSRHAPARAPSLPVRTESADTLPFVSECDGRLWVRRMVLGPSHRVGVVPVDLALTADPAFLALLALDPAVGACSFRNALYLDLETTGLAQGSVPCLVGLMHAQGEDLVLEQLLLKDLDDEGVMLERIAERVAAASVLVTFNGKTFDWPLLRSRFTMNRLPVPTPPTHLDLLHVARRVHRSADVPRSIKLQRLEIDLLGLERVGDIPGSEIGAAYWHWLRTGEDSTMRAVVDHNAWDVYAMAALVGLYGRPLEEELAPGSARGLHDFLPQVAWTLKRAGAMGDARKVADRAVRDDGGTLAYLTRAEIAKALRDRDLALADFEQVLALESLGIRKPDLGPGTRSSTKARLELAKLYEHHVRAFGKAHEVATGGTGEDEDALARRLSRLARKATKTEKKAPST